MSILISSAVWKANVGDPVAKLVLLSLADNANDEGRCWPSIASICDRTQLSERTVQRKMRELEAAGLVGCDRGRNRCDYVVRIEQLEAIANPVRLSPRQAVTPSHSQLRGVTVAVAGCHADGGGCQSGSYLTNEPSLNHQLTTIEPPEVLIEVVEKRAKAKKPEIDMSKARGTLEELRAFAKEIGLPDSDGEFMFLKWDENEWTKNAGKEKIRDWRKTLRTWKAGGWLPSQQSRAPQGQSPTSKPDFLTRKCEDVGGKPVAMPEYREY